MTTGTAEERVLPGGLLLRSCRPGDLTQVGALLAERGDPTDAEDQRLVAGDPDTGPDATAVVVDGDRVVSTATLLAESVRVADVVVPAGQLELVATDRDHEGRGLVRALVLPVTDDGLGPVRPGGRLQGPGSVGGAGVAPDQLGALLLGPHGMHGLARRRPDVYPGRDPELYEALFPPLRADLLTYYLPY